MDSGLRHLVNLKTLDMAGNAITKVCNLENMLKLEELWLNDNKIDTFNGLECIKSKCLNTIYLERNPIELNDPKLYKQNILKLFPSLIQLDACQLIERIRANKLEQNFKQNESVTNNDKE